MTQLAVRLDMSTEAALERLVAQTGRTRSQVIREAITAYERTRLVETMRRQSIDLATDEADVAEAQAVMSEMRQRRAW